MVTKTGFMQYSAQTLKTKTFLMRLKISISNSLSKDKIIKEQIRTNNNNSSSRPTII
jgi:hypothetical protein